MTVGELIKELSQHNFDDEVQVMVNKICQVSINDVFSRFNQHNMVTLFVQVDIDELTQ